MHDNFESLDFTLSNLYYIWVLSGKVIVYPKVYVSGIPYPITYDSMSRGCCNAINTSLLHIERKTKIHFYYVCVVRGSVMHFPTPFPDLSRQEDIYWTGKMWKNLLKYTPRNVLFFTFLRIPIHKCNM